MYGFMTHALIINRGEHANVTTVGSLENFACKSGFGGRLSEKSGAVYLCQDQYIMVVQCYHDMLSKANPVQDVNSTTAGSQH